MKWDEVRDKILEADFKMNPYAKTYFNALERTEQDYGEHGVKTQIIYILTNIRAKKGKQQQIKQELMEYARSR